MKPAAFSLRKHKGGRDAFVRITDFPWLTISSPHFVLCLISTLMLFMTDSGSWKLSTSLYNLSPYFRRVDIYYENTSKSVFDIKTNNYRDSSSFKNFLQFIKINCSSRTINGFGCRAADSINILLFDGWCQNSQAVQGWSCISTQYAVDL